MRGRIFIRCAAVAALGLGLASCEEKANPAKADAVVSTASTLDPKAVQAVTDSAHADLNSVPALVQQLLAAFRNAGQARSSQLVIQVDGQPVQLDAWLWNRGFIELLGVSGGEPVFGLTPTGTALADKPMPWFWLKATTPASGDCQVGAKITDMNCTLTTHYQIVSSPSGKAAFGAQAFAPFDVTDSAETSPQGWVAGPYEAADTAPRHIAVDAILGPAAERDAVRAAYIQAVTEKAQAAAAAPADTSRTAADASALY